jgi:hypothetical protein
MSQSASTQIASDGSVSTQTQPAPPSTAASPYSADVVQRLLDRAAYFQLYSSSAIGENKTSERAAAIACEVIRQGDQTIGYLLHERLHRFEVVMQAPTRDSGLRASNTVGEELGTFQSRWLFCPDDFDAVPDCEPPPTRVDHSRRQRFVMLDGDCTLGANGDGFRGFGTGTTFPLGNGKSLAGAVGNLMEGRGRLEGVVGTYTYCGTLGAHEGFRGSLMLRVMDPQGVIQTTRALPAIAGERWPERGVTYLMFRGQARETDKVLPMTDSAGKPEGLNVAQQLRLFQTDTAPRGRGGLRSTSHIGQVIGEIDAQIIFNPAAPGGDAANPIPYTAFDEYKFTDRRGRSVGSLFIDEGEGRTFNLQVAGAPGQPAIRFGGFGPVLGGTGMLEGTEGLMTDNSVVSFTPHVSASVYVIRVNDPEGRYRVG